MRIKRLQLDVEFECSSLHVFHTAYPDFSGDPPTLVSINGHEFEGTVEYHESDSEYIVKIKKLEHKV